LLKIGEISIRYMARSPPLHCEHIPIVRSMVART
jgi:hypothetical protein